MTSPSPSPATGADTALDPNCRFQKTAALNVRSRLHYSSGGVGSIRQRRAAAGHKRPVGFALKLSFERLLS